MARTLKAAVLLAGCGHKDGAEIREAVFTLLALDQHGADAQCLAPNALQAHVIDHVTGKIVEGVPRNMLEEASRIARFGKCLDLAEASCRAGTGWPRICAASPPGGPRGRSDPMWQPL